MSGIEEDSQETFDQGFEIEPENDDGAREPASGENIEAQASPVAQVEQAADVPAQQAPQPPEVQKPAMLAEAPQNIAEELENLRKLNPEAAELAMEDSPDGAAIRSRLETYGAEHAQDRAEMTLFMRQEQIQKKREMQAHMEAAHRNFLATIKREVPDYFALMNDPGRRDEAGKYIQNLDNWIGSRPYSEGVGLMKIRQSGTADQVVSLIRQFEKAMSGNMKDATAMLAVPSRGAPATNEGLGDKDDFDAGWNLHN